MLREWGHPQCPIGPESTPSPCTFPPLVACGSCCVHRGGTSARSLNSTNTNTHLPDWCAYGSKWGKMKKKVHNLNNIMRSLNQNDPRTKCCQKQNTGKTSVKIYIVYCGTVVVRGQNKTAVLIYRSEAQGVVGHWNRIPKKTVTAPSLTKFKNHLDNSFGNMV